MQIPFVGPFNTARSLNASAQRSVNCYLEFDRGTPRAPVALYGTPGLVLKFTLGDAPCRGFIEQGVYRYQVAGDSVYRVATDYSAVLLGTIGTTSGRVSMASNGTEVLIVDGSSGWIATSSALTEIADSDFPDGVTVAGFQDGFFTVSGDGTGQVYWNETPNAGTNWNGLDFATAEGAPDATMGHIHAHRELWLFGEKTVELWTNTGDADSLFQRSGNTFLEVGCAARFSSAKADNTVFWLGQDERGGAMVFRAQGYNPQRVSNHAVETAIQGYSTISDAFAYTMQIAGHVWYVLTFPTADATWTYDASTDEWFEWLWRDPDTNELHRHRSNCHVYSNGEHLVGDWETGKVYALDLDTYTDNGDPIYRLRRTQTISKGGKEQFFGILEIDAETGVGLATGQGSDPQLMLRYSNDGGHSWSDIETASLGAAGEYDTKVRFDPSGSARNRVWELSMTDPVKFAIFGADCDVEG
jgi:hypothetical protein